MIYLDTSVVLAQLLAEDRCPPATIWSETLVSSRLLEYEVFTQLNNHKLVSTHGETAGQILARVAFIEMTPLVLARVFAPFPVAVRTMDAIHLASMDFLLSQHQRFSLASYDRRLNEVAAKMGVLLIALDERG